MNKILRYYLRSNLIVINFNEVSTIPSTMLLIQVYNFKLRKNKGKSCRYYLCDNKIYKENYYYNELLYAYLSDTLC